MSTLEDMPFGTDVSACRSYKDDQHSRIRRRGSQDIALLTIGHVPGQDDADGEDEDRRGDQLRHPGRVQRHDQHRRDQRASAKKSHAEPAQELLRLSDAGLLPETVAAVAGVVGHGQLRVIFVGGLEAGVGHDGRVVKVGDV